MWQKPFCKWILFTWLLYCNIKFGKMTALRRRNEVYIPRRFCNHTKYLFCYQIWKPIIAEEYYIFFVSFWCVNIVSSVSTFSFSKVNKLASLQRLERTYHEKCCMYYLKNNWMTSQTIEIWLWILRRCSDWYMTTIYCPNNAWKATETFETVCNLYSSYT